jgi:hypothetical protein
MSVPPKYDMGHEWTDSHGDLDDGRMDRFDPGLTCSGNGDMQCISQAVSGGYPELLGGRAELRWGDAMFVSVALGSYPAHLAVGSGGYRAFWIIRAVRNQRNRDLTRSPALNVPSMTASRTVFARGFHALAPSRSGPGGFGRSVGEGIHGQGARKWLYLPSVSQFQ